MRRPYNPNWRTQPRDQQGRWSKVAGAIGSGLKKLVGSAARSVTGPFEFGYGANLYKGTLGGSVTTTKNLPGGYSLTTTASTRLHPTSGRSVFQQANDSARDAIIARAGGRRAQNVAAFLLDRPVRLGQDSGVRVQSGYIRSRSQKEIQNAQMRTARRKAKKLRQVEYYRANARSGLPGTITGQGRAQRRSRGTR